MLILLQGSRCCEVKVLPDKYNKPKVRNLRSNCKGHLLN